MTMILSCCFAFVVVSLPAFCVFFSWCISRGSSYKQSICPMSHCGTNLFHLSHWSYLHWWNAWRIRALAVCKPPWLRLWSSLCCILCPTWTQPEPPPGPHNCSGRPLSGSAEMPCWESVRGHTSCPVSELSGLQLTLFMYSPQWRMCC